MSNLSAPIAATMALAASFMVSVAFGATSTRIPDTVVCVGCMAKYDTTQPAPFGPKAAAMSSAKPMPSVSPAYGFTFTIWPANAWSLDAISRCCSAVKRRLASFSRSLSTSTLASAASCLAPSICTSLFCESTAAWRSFTASNSRWAVANNLLFLITTSCAMNTPTASTTVSATRTMYAVFQLSMDRPKSWVRSVRLWINDTFSPLSLVCAFIMLGASVALVITAYKCNTKRPLDKS